MLPRIRWMMQTPVVNLKVKGASTGALFDGTTDLSCAGTSLTG